MGNIHYMDHPLIQHKVTLMRETGTGAKEFRAVSYTHLDVYKRQVWGGPASRKPDGLQSVRLSICF